MDDFNNQFWVYVAKGLGSICGSFLSIIYMLPNTRREAFFRFIAGLIIGLVFSGTVAIKISQSLNLADLINPVELALVSGAITSFCAWWFLGAVFRFINTIGNHPSKKSNKKS